MASSNNTGNNEELTPSVEETLLNESGSIARVKSFSWIWFINKERIHDINPVQCGKWIFFFSPFKTSSLHSKPPSWTTLSEPQFLMASS